MGTKINIITVDEHSFCPDLLTERGWILDAGCFGMGFTNHFTNQFVLSVDIGIFPGKYFRAGLSTFNGKATILDNDDPQALRIVNKIQGENVVVDVLNGEVALFSIAHIEQSIDSKFDLIKLDIEGEEYPILKEAKHPIAKQVSVEFHAHTGANTKQEIDELLDWLGQWYDIYGRVWEERHGCSENYWDVLLIAK